MDLPWPEPWDRLRLHVVTGKGGTGKTTVAAALALALAATGQRVLLAEVESRQSLARLFDSAPLNYAETRIAVTRNGGEVVGLSVDAEDSLLEYLEMFYGMRRAASALRKLGVVDFATTIAPGVRDVLLFGKVYETARRRVNGSPAYDTVVLDAPPTGRVARFLTASREVSTLARMGPIKNQSDSMMRLLSGREAVVHIVTLLEEMPVQETVDAVADLKANNLTPGAIFVNLISEPLLGPADLAAALRGAGASGELSRADVTGALAQSGLRLSSRSVNSLLSLGRGHAERVELAERHEATLVNLGLPLLRLPVLTGGIDLGALYELADVLTEQGVGT